jgi:small conductance mechanosensitive channel
MASGSRRLLEAALRGLALLALLVLTVGTPAHAFAAESATVRYQGEALFRVSASSADAARERAEEIARRITALAERPEVASLDVEIVADGPERQLLVDGVRIATVTMEDAEEAVTSVDVLALRWTRALDAALDRASSASRAPATRFGTNVIAAVRAAFGGVLESSAVIIPRALAAMLVVLMFWLAATLVRRALRWLFHRIIADVTVENLLKQVGYYAVWTLGMVVAVDALGVDRRSLVTGLGLTGLALGFALKDILSNFVSGLLLLAMRPFRIGDQIVIGDAEGTVERVEMRATQIRTYDGRVILVPNAEIFTSRLTNNTAAPVRRASFRVRLGYQIALEPTLELFTSAVRATPGVLETPAVSAYVAELAEDDALVELRFWTDSRRSDHVQTLAAARRAVWAAALRENVPLPRDRDQTQVVQVVVRPTDR